MNKKIFPRMELSCGHALKFEPTGDTAFAPNEIGHQKTQEIIDAYNDLFLNIYPKFHPSRMLEIGIWHGGSLALWRDVFDTCSIIGVDRSDLRLPQAIRHFSEDDRITCVWFSCPSDNLREIDECDLIIDDGYHGTEVVIPTFKLLWPKLRPGGIYVIEDWKPDHCHPSELLAFLGDEIREYWPMDDSGSNAPFNIIVYRGLVAIVKKKE